MNKDNYTGHKKIYGVYHKILNEVPKCSTFVEAFAGSASISKIILEHNSNIGITLNEIDKAAAKQLLKSFPEANIINGDAMKLLTAYIKSESDHFIFIDPPYHHSTRPNSTKLYKHEMSNDQHRQLLNLANQSKNKIMIIHPKCDLYDKMLEGWRRVEVKIRYHKKTSVECIYMNYDKPKSLMVDKFLGKDCWDRQRIKRKVDRFISKLKQLPELERNMMLNRIRAEF